MDEAARADRSRPSRRRIFFGLSAGSLAVAGILAAFAVLSGGDSWKAVGTALLVFSLNLLVLISFSSAHSWLRQTQRAASGLAVLGSIVFIWISVPYEWDPAGRTVPSPLRVLEDTSFALWSIVGALSLLCLFSLCWRFIDQSAALKLCYALSFGFTLAAASLTTILGSISSLDSYGVLSSPLGLLAGALAILGAASSLIVLIAALLERSARRRAQQSSMLPAGTMAPSAIRDEIRALARSGELLDLLLENPATVERLRAALWDPRSAKIERSQSSDSTD